VTQKINSKQKILRYATREGVMLTRSKKKDITYFIIQEEGEQQRVKME
jgi:hypothetical protein